MAQYPSWHWHFTTAYTALMHSYLCSNYKTNATIIWTTPHDALTSNVWFIKELRGLHMPSV